MAAPGAGQLQRSALCYARHGLAVFPCQPRGKRPLCAHGLHDASTDPDTIRAWWARWPAANVAVAVPGGHVVVDVDGRDGWSALEAEGFSLPATVTAVTGRGEFHRHLWYRLPDGATVSNAVKLLAGVDLRARGGYVVAPPSMTVGPYRWAGKFNLDAIAEAPSWVVERCAPVGAGEHVARPVSDWVAILRGPVPEGHRHETLLRVAGLLLRRHDPLIALALARAWHDARCTPPLEEHEAARILAAALRLEQRRVGGAR